MIVRPSWCALLASVVLGATACIASLDSAGFEDDDVAPAQCFADADCALAGPTCCDCPTYATPTTSGWGDTCANIDCVPADPPVACAALVARCELGACIAACAPVTCDLSCPQGFAVDAAGCLTCACNSMPQAPTCELDTDCVEVPADCCGCARGGSDTAVPRALVDQHLAGLGCSTDPSTGACPDVSTCDPAQVPRCRDHQCALIGPGDPTWPEPPAGACGRPDLPPCPAGQVCVLNRSSDAGPLGLGVCAAPTP